MGNSRKPAAKSQREQP